MTSLTAHMLAKVISEAGEQKLINFKNNEFFKCIMLLISASISCVVSPRRSCDRPFCISGVPPGVVNMVFGVGPRAGEALVKHPNVPLISFTGSTAVGQRIQAISAPFVKKLSLEVSSGLVL